MARRLKQAEDKKRRASPQRDAYLILPTGFYSVHHLHRLAPLTQEQVVEARAAGALGKLRRGPRNQLLAKGAAVLALMDRLLKEE